MYVLGRDILENTRVTQISQTSRIIEAQLSLSPMKGILEVIGSVSGESVAAIQGVVGYCEKVGARKGLSVDEIFGNLFVIFAGHDTPANTHLACFCWRRIQTYKTT
ncbi:hypothetical protein GGR54DRAFT_615781 [Hypoxylon sp. NC1633]|nr:hypothetical protein GGR54DRAFT_615781 [Hypoxylon sp. NC1633]